MHTARKNNVLCTRRVHSMQMTRRFAFIATINTNNERSGSGLLRDGKRAGPEYDAPRSCSRLHKAVIMPPSGAGKLYAYMYAPAGWVFVFRGSERRRSTNQHIKPNELSGRVTYFAALPGWRSIPENALLGPDVLRPRVRRGNRCK